LVDLTHQLAQGAKLFANLREPLIDLGPTGLELLLSARSLLLKDGLVLGHQLLDARLLDFALDAREIGVDRRDDPLGLARIQLRSACPTLASEQGEDQEDQEDQQS